jgi:hypothetical protein
MVGACRLGPPRAAVSRVDVADAEQTDAAKFGSGFVQAPSL